MLTSMNWAISQKMKNGFVKFDEKRRVTMNRNMYQAIIRESKERSAKYGITEEQVYSRKMIENSELQNKFSEIVI